MSFSNILDRLNIPNMTRQGLTVSIGGASGSQQNPNQPELKDMHPLDPGTTKRRNPNYDWKKACERFYHKPSPHDLLEKCIACIEEEIRELPWIVRHRITDKYTPGTPEYLRMAQSIPTHWPSFENDNADVGHWTTKDASFFSQLRV